MRELRDVVEDQLSERLAIIFCAGFFFAQEDLPRVTTRIAYHCKRKGYSSHILGCDKSPFDLVVPMIQQHAFRSLDTSKPFSLALYADTTPVALRTRPKDYFYRRFSHSELNRARANVLEFRREFTKADQVRES